MNVKALYVTKKAVMNGSMIICFIVGVIFMTVMSISPLMAHPPKDRPDPGRMISVLKDRLQLTDEQAEKMQAIFEEQDKKMRALFEKFHDKRRREESNMRKEMDATHSEMETKIQSILTEEQMKAFQALRDEEHRRMKNDRRDGRRGRPGNPPIDRE